MAEEKLISSDDWQRLPDHGPSKFDNIVCTFCGVVLDPAVAVEEHLIGRRFVPRGTLDGHWNLITQSCVNCNSEKGNLEDDISAITMQPDVTGCYADPDPRLANEARRKGSGAFNRKTGRRVERSNARLNLQTEFAPGIRMSFGFVGLNEVDHRRIFRLAWFHFQGFFSFITFDKGLRRGFFPPEGCSFCPVLYVARADWGNNILRGFAETVQVWENRIWCDAADGYFKAAIRHAPGDNPLWSWAFEWNKNYRIIGFVGAMDVVTRIVNQLPPLVMKAIDDRHRIRLEVPLSEGEDILFSPPESMESEGD